MKKVILTCPFTGQEFTALESADGNLFVNHALTGEQIKINWNCTINRYNLQKSALKHIETVNFSDASEILGVSHQRISQIAKEGIIQAHKVGNSSVFVKDDVYRYRDSRKVGAPKKKVATRKD